MGLMPGNCSRYGRGNSLSIWESCGNLNLAGELIGNCRCENVWRDVGELADLRPQIKPCCQ